MIVCSRQASNVLLLVWACAKGCCTSSHAPSREEVSCLHFCTLMQDPAQFNCTRSSSTHFLSCLVWSKHSWCMFFSSNSVVQSQLLLLLSFDPFAARRPMQSNATSHVAICSCCHHICMLQQTQANHTTNLCFCQLLMKISQQACWCQSNTIQNPNLESTWCSALLAQANAGLGMWVKHAERCDWFCYF